MFAAQKLSAHLLLSVVVFSLLVHNTNANQLRKSPAPDRTLGESLICQLKLLNVQFENQEGQEIYHCLIENGQNGFVDLPYTIELPLDFIQEHGDCMDFGPCYISIPGGTLHDGDERSISIPDDSTFTLVEGFGSRQRRLSITGRHETLVVHVMINGSLPDPSTTDLAGSVFGLGDNPAEQTTAGQYSACSFGQLEFFPAEGDNIVNGVMNIEIKKGDGTLNILSMLSDLTSAVKDKMPIGMEPRHIMYVLPYGTMFQGSLNWVAFGYVGGYSSFYNNGWGDSLSATMHEIGHNLGFHHSGEGTEQYGDKSGLMGYSYRQRGGPLMCFDGFKLYILGWYSDKTAIVDPSAGGRWNGILTAFVDYDSNAATTVLIKVGPAHLLFNKKKGMNAGTGEKGDLVTVSYGQEARSQSWILGGLGAGQTLTVEGAVIEVCSMGNTQDTDYAEVSIYTTSQGSGCF